MTTRSGSAVAIAVASAVLLLPLSSGAQMPQVVGIVTAVEQARNPAGPITAGSTLFPGDIVETETIGNAQIQAGTTRLTLFGDSSARLFPSGTGLVVELERGTIAYSASAAPSLLVYALDLRIHPVSVQGAAGQITIVARCDVRVTSQRGPIEILGKDEKQKKIVDDSKSEDFTSLRAVDYRDSWQPIPADYPDIDPNSQYHHSHGHATCPAAPPRNGAPPIPGGSAALARAGEAAVLGAGVGIIVWKALESPDAPSPQPNTNSPKKKS